MNTFDRKLKQSNTDSYEIDVSQWANGEDITTFNATNEDGNVTVGQTQIVGPLLTVLLTGVNLGNAAIKYEYTTSTRSDCVKTTVKVIADC